MATQVTFTPNWEENIDTSKFLDAIGETVADTARRLAPVDTGELKGSIGYATAPNEGKLGAVRIFATADHAEHVELGTSRTPAQAYLRPALDAIGGGR